MLIEKGKEYWLIFSSNKPGFKITPENCLAFVKDVNEPCSIYEGYGDLARPITKREVEEMLDGFNLNRVAIMALKLAIFSNSHFIF